MTAVRRLTLLSAFLTLIALLATARVRGDSGKNNNRVPDRIQPVPAHVEKNLVEDLAHTKFSDRNLVTYQTQDGALLFGLQVQPKLDAVAARPRDLLLMVDTSAGQVRSPLLAARQMAEAICKAAGPNDRLAIWTINTPAATHNLTRGFAKPGSAAVQDALQALRREVPLGAVALNNGLSKALASFRVEDGRQRAIVFLGNGMSVAEAFTNQDRTKLCQKLVDSEVAVFPVPIGPIEKLRQGSYNLHGLATGTGGLVVRSLPGEKLDEVIGKLNAALAAPILYTRKFEAPKQVVEFFPKKLPPLRGDAPTLLLGKLKPADKLTYTVEGTVAGKSVKVRMSEDVGAAELENFFLVSALGQWERAKDSQETPALIRADRALAMLFEQNRLNRDELIGQAQWAIEQDQLTAAEELLKRARDIDPRDPEIDAGLRIIEKLRTKQLTKRQLKDALVRADDALVTKIEKKKIQRGRFDKLVAQADDPAKKMPDERVQPNFNNPRDRDDLLRLQKQRMAVEEQRITQIVNDVERQARRLLQSDPDAAHDLLRRNLANIRENPDLGPAVKQNLLNRLETALRNVDTQGVRIKRDLEDRMRMMADAQRRLALAEEQVRGEEQIRRRLQAFSMLMNQWRFNEAYKEALILQQDTVARGAPINPTMVAAYYMGLTGDHLREVQEVRRASEERYLLTMLQVEKSHIPFPDEPPVQFPPKETWKEITKLRKGVWDYTGLGEDDSARDSVRKIEKKLSQKVNLNEGIPPNTALKEALDFLSDRYELTFIVDSNAFTAVGLQKVEEQPVQLPKMVGVSLATVLRLLLGQVKGEPYSGTYLIRRDYIEITTTYHAAAEKVVRAYPVADLVIPIPNAVNQQALQQSLNVYGQFLQQSPFMNGFGMMGMMGGMMGMMGMGMGMGMGNGGVAGAQMFNPMFNAFQMQGGLPGNNQFGNLGGQFGMQGQDYSRELLQLVTNVIAPREWSKFVDPNQQPGQGGLGQIPAAADAPGPEDGPLNPDKPELLNQIGYYRPTLSLVVRGSSRIHTRPGSGLTGGPKAAAMGPAINRDGALVIRPGERRDPNVAGANARRDDPKAKPNVPAKPPVRVANVDARKVWQETLAKCLEKGKGNFDPGLIIATADFLVEHRKYDHAAEFLKASIRLGLVEEAWAFESLAIALQLSGGSPEEVERAQMSVVDLQPQDAQGYRKAAQAMADQKRYGTAVAFCRQSALLDPNQSQVYSDALQFAEMAGDGEGVTWAAGNLLRRDWPIDNDGIHARAQARLADFAKGLEQRRPADATRLVNQLQRTRERDLVLLLTFQGQAALDLKVREPIGTVCSFQQRVSPGGGTLVGDNLSDLSRQSYVAAQAFSGEYEVSVERIWGRPTGAKATVEVIRHQGTERESRELHTLVIDPAKPASLKLNLANGRRQAVAAVPPPAQRPERSVDEQTSADRVLNKLRSLTDPSLVVNESGMRGGVRSTGRSARVPTTDLLKQAKEKKGPAPLEGVSYQTRLSTSVPNSLDMMVKSVVSPDQKEMRIKLNPVFQTTNRGPAPAAVNPVLPGGN